MSIFKKASVLPIQRAAVSMGLDDYPSDESGDFPEKPSIKDNDWATKQLIYELHKDNMPKYANYCNELLKKGYSFEKIKELLALFIHFSEGHIKV